MESILDLKSDDFLDPFYIYKMETIEYERCKKFYDMG